MKLPLVLATVAGLWTSVVWAAPVPPADGNLAAELQAIQAQVKAQQAQIESQQNELQQLRAANSETWLNERRAEEVKALVREVLSDADTRASLLEGGMTAGHNGKNFFLASEDGSFLLNIRGQIQIRYTADFRNDPPAAPSTDEAESGFAVRRAKLFFTGNIGSPKVDYWVQMAANKDTTAVELEAAYVGYSYSDSLRVWAGRFVDPLLRDNFTSGANQLAAERSTVSYVFASNEDYVEGVGMEWKACDAFKVRATINDGIASGNTGTSPGPSGFLNNGNDFQNDAVDVAFTVRGDLKLAGDWKQMDDYSAWSGEPLGLFVGAAAHYELGETGDKQAIATTPLTGPYDDLLLWTVDGSLENAGFNFYAALVGLEINGTDANALGTLHNYGVVVQAGYMVIPDKLEPFARYEWIGVDDKIAGANDLNIVTAGANYYIKKSTVKFTADVVWFVDPMTNASTLGAFGATGTGLTGIGVLPDSAGKDNQLLVRAQVQLLF